MTNENNKETSVSSQSNTAIDSPASFARAFLFTIAKPMGSAREYQNSSIVPSIPGVHIEYSGQELRQDDYAVFLSILNLGKTTSLGEPIHFSARSMLMTLGWGETADDYQHLRDCCGRLSATNVTISRENTKGYAGSLLRTFSWIEQEEIQQTTCVALIEPDIVRGHQLMN